MKFPQLRALLILLLCAVAIQGNARERESGYNFTALFGYTFFDQERNLEDDPAFTGGFGYDFSKTWAAEILIGTADLESDDDVEIDNIFTRLDILHHFTPEDTWRPFLVAGVGHNELEDPAGNTHDETMFNLGAGLKHEISDEWDLRFDVRGLYSHDIESKDTMLNLGLTYLFGGVSAPPADTDGDGVIDEDDQCPGTAYGVKVDSVGCEIIGDSDNDGVLDNVDKCPNTAPNTEVDESGCPYGDADKDGVKDNKDACPNTPAGARVDEKGCRIMLEESVSIKLQVNFATNSDKVTDAYLPEIERVVKFMRQYPDSNIVVEGHTDDRGAAEYNQKLSERRANAVRDVVVNRFGVNPERISAVGYGEAKPLEDNATDSGRRQNRRVVAVIEATTMVGQ